MDIAAIGVGGAGGRIVDRLVRELGTGTGTGSSLEMVHAIDTDTESLAALSEVPQANRHAIGQFETGGDGTDGDRELAAEIVDNERMELRRAVEDGIPTTIDAIVVPGGLAGGTASVVGPALVAGLARVYEQPVYAVSVLPAAEKTDDQRRANTAQALTDLNEAATAQIVFDNDAWLWGSRSLETHGGRLNGALAERVGEVLTIGQDGETRVGERVIDGQDVLATLSAGGLVTVGYADRSLAAWRGASSSLLDGLKRNLLGDDTDEVERGVAVQRTLEWATRGTLTFECPRTGATHGLVAFRGPPEWLRGDAISRGREWLADRVGIERLRSGDVPTPGANSLGVLVVLAGIERTPRIESFRADQTEESTENEETAPEEPAATDDTDGSGEGGEDGDAEAEEATSTEAEEWGVAPGETGGDEDSDGDVVASGTTGEDGAAAGGTEAESEAYGAESADETAEATAEDDSNERAVGSDAETSEGDGEKSPTDDGNRPTDGDS